MGQTTLSNFDGLYTLYFFYRYLSQKPFFEILNWMKTFCHVVKLNVRCVVLAERLF